MVWCGLTGSATARPARDINGGQEIAQVRVGWGVRLDRVLLVKREGGLIEHNMARDDHAAGDTIQAPVALVIL